MAQNSARNSSQAQSTTQSFAAGGGNSHRLPITVRLDQFEGPLDLLLFLIQGHELDISKISIKKITDQYLSYVQLMQELNFDLASEFLVMAATLVHWKSKALLPIDPHQQKDASEIGEAPLSQEELVRQLLEHQRFQEAGQELSRLPIFGLDIFKRPNRKAPVERIWRDMDVSDLALTYQDILVRQRKRTQILKKETVSLADKISLFSEHLSVGQLTSIRKLMNENPVRAEVVVTFLASLELGRLKKLKLHQEGTYQDIFLELIDSLVGFDLSLASGFDSVADAAGLLPNGDVQVTPTTNLDNTILETQTL